MSQAQWAVKPHPFLFFPSLPPGSPAAAAPTSDCIWGLLGSCEPKEYSMEGFYGDETTEVANHPSMRPWPVGGVGPLPREMLTSCFHCRWNPPGLLRHWPGLWVSSLPTPSHKAVWSFWGSRKGPPARRPLWHFLAEMSTYLLAKMVASKGTL